MENRLALVFVVLVLFVGVVFSSVGDMSDVSGKFNVVDIIDKWNKLKNIFGSKEKPKEIKLIKEGSECNWNLENKYSWCEDKKGNKICCECTKVGAFGLNSNWNKATNQEECKKAAK